MQKMFRLFCGLAAVGLLPGASSCRKKTTTPAEYLTGGWKLTARTSTYSINGFPFEQNAYSQLPACRQDDLTFFASNGSSFLDAGGSTCTAGEPQITRLGTWSLSESGAVLTRYDTAGIGTSVAVTTLDATALVTAAADSIAIGPLSYRSRTVSTYTRQ